MNKFEWNKGKLFQREKWALFKDNIKMIGKPSSLCLICKGGRMLCGKFRCPIITKVQSLIKTSSSIPLTKNLQGSTPPGTFVGRFGYPKIFIGPMLPPYHGDTEILDTPELWVGKSIDEILDYRYSLVRGMVRMNVSDAAMGTNLLDIIQEVSMGISSIDSEASFTKKPKGVLSISRDSQPFGPSAPLKSFKTSTIKVDKVIEKAYYDRDLGAAEGVKELYNKSIPISRIQRAFSVGMLGRGNKRRLVPTRWSITAIDNIISLELIKEIKQYDTLDEYEVYSFINLDNIFFVIFIPERWSFEWIEAWFPGTVWNVNGKYPSIMGDSEGYMGRSTYAEVGGCYYSARLAATEKLKFIKKQAKILMLREIRPGYILPVGVWNVRESIRHALRKEPKRFYDLKTTLNYACKILTIPFERWIENSHILKEALFQRKITDF